MKGDAIMAAFVAPQHPIISLEVIAF